LGPVYKDFIVTAKRCSNQAWTLIITHWIYLPFAISPIAPDVVNPTVHVSDIEPSAACFENRPRLLFSKGCFLVGEFRCTKAKEREIDPGKATLRTDIHLFENGPE
jgi:hypothetical protein